MEFKKHLHFLEKCAESHGIEFDKNSNSLSDFFNVMFQLQSKGQNATAIFESVLHKFSEEKAIVETHSGQLLEAEKLFLKMVDDYNSR